MGLRSLFCSAWRKLIQCCLCCPCCPWCQCEKTESRSQKRQSQSSEKKLLSKEKQSVKKPKQEPTRDIALTIEPSPETRHATDIEGTTEVEVLNTSKTIASVKPGTINKPKPFEVTEELDIETKIASSKKWVSSGQELDNSSALKVTLLPQIRGLGEQQSSEQDVASTQLTSNTKTNLSSRRTDFFRTSTEVNHFTSEKLSLPIRKSLTPSSPSTTSKLESHSLSNLTNELTEVPATVHTSIPLIESHDPESEPFKTMVANPGLQPSQGLAFEPGKLAGLSAQILTNGVQILHQTLGQKSEIASNKTTVDSSHFPEPPSLKLTDSIQESHTTDDTTWKPTAATDASPKLYDLSIETISESDAIRDATSGSQATIRTICEQDTTKEAMFEPHATQDSISKPQAKTDTMSGLHTTTTIISEQKPKTDTIAEHESTTFPISDQEPVADAISEHEPTTDKICKQEPTTVPIFEQEPTTDTISDQQPITEPPLKQEPTTEVISEKKSMTFPISDQEPTTDTFSKKVTTFPISEQEPTTVTFSDQKPIMDPPLKHEPMTEAISGKKSTTFPIFDQEPEADTISEHESTTDTISGQKPITNPPLKQESTTEAISETKSTTFPISDQEPTTGKIIEPKERLEPSIPQEPTDDCYPPPNENTMALIQEEFQNSMDFGIKKHKEIMNKLLDTKQPFTEAQLTKYHEDNQKIILATFEETFAQVLKLKHEKVEIIFQERYKKLEKAIKSQLTVSLRKHEVIIDKVTKMVKDCIHVADSEYYDQMDAYNFNDSTEEEFSVYHDKIVKEVAEKFDEGIVQKGLEVNFFWNFELNQKMEENKAEYVSEKFSSQKLNI